MRHRFKWIIALAIVVAISGCREVRTFFKKEACFDAGGMWDYQQHACQAGALVTLYPLRYPPHFPPVPPMQDAVTRSTLLANLSQLQPGDSSAEVVRKLGVAPLFYYAGASKNFQAVPTYFVMEYHFFKDDNLTSATKSQYQYLTLLFDKHEHLKEIWYQHMPELAGMQLQVALKNMQDSPL